MSSKEIRVAILVYNLFEQSEFEEPISALRNKNIQVDIIAVGSSKKLQAMQHDKPGDTFEADLSIQEANPNDYGALILPGGTLNADKLRMVEAARHWVNNFLDNDKLIAAICHAPWLLVSADAVEERRLTSYYTLQDDIRNAGGEWVDAPVIADGNLITSRKPDDLMQFNDAIINWLQANSRSMTEE